MNGGRSTTGKPPPSEIAGQVIQVDEPYARQEGIGWAVLAPLLIPAALARGIGLLIAAVTRTGATTGGGRRSLKELRRGPEVLVTTFLVRPANGPTPRTHRPGGPTSARRCSCRPPSACSSPPCW